MDFPLYIIRVHWTFHCPLYKFTFTIKVHQYNGISPEKQKHYINLINKVMVKYDNSNTFSFYYIFDIAKEISLIEKT